MFCSIKLGVRYQNRLPSFFYINKIKNKGLIRCTLRNARPQRCLEGPSSSRAWVVCYHPPTICDARQSSREGETTLILTLCPNKYGVKKLNIKSTDNVAVCCLEQPIRGRNSAE